MRRRHRILIFMLIVVAVIGASIVGAAVWLHAALPQIAAAQIGRLINAQVETGTFDFNLDGSVSVAGLVIRPRQGEPKCDDAVLRAKNVYAKFDRRSLLGLAPRLTDLRIEDFMLDAQLNLDSGRWNVGTLRLNRPGGKSGGFPAITLRRGKLRYCKVSGSSVEVVTSVPVEASFGRNVEADPGYVFEIKTARLSGGYGQSHLTGHWLPGELTLAGGLSSADIPSLERAWAIDVLAAELKYDRDGGYTLDLRVKDLHGKQALEVSTLRFVSPTALDTSGALQNLQRFFTRFRPTGTVASIQVQASGNLKLLQESQVTGKLVCKDVSICDSKFPYRIDHLTGELDFTQSMVVANRLAGNHGDVDLWIDLFTKGSGKDRQYRYRIRSSNVALDTDLYAALQPNQKRLWDDFQPAGRVAADYYLSRTSPTDKRMYVSVDLNDVTAAFHEFPYRVHGLTGNLSFDYDSITASDIVSTAGGRHIRLNGKVTGRSAGKPICYIDIDANNIPLDATLRDALPVRHREWYGQLDVNGLADMRARVFSTGDANDVGSVSFLADVSCRGSSLKSRQSPLALSNVEAALVITPESLSLTRLAGLYGRSPVAATGGIRFERDSKLMHCHMKITAEAVPLNEATLGLLSQSTSRRLAAFRPEGDVNVAIELKKADSNEPTDYSVTVDCLGDRINHERFPYPLQDIRGTISLTKDEIVLQGVTARPAQAVVDSDAHATGQSRIADSQSRIQVDGSATLAQDGFGKGSFTVKAVEVPFTEELGRALPKALAGTYRELSPAGPFDLDLTTLKIDRQPTETLVEVRGKADFESCRVRVGGAGMELCGALEMEGSYGTASGFSKGRAHLAAQRLAIRSKAVADTHIDAVYDPNTRKWSARDFLGHCYGGKVLGSLEIGNADRIADAKSPMRDSSGAANPQSIEYSLRMAFDGVDLRQFLQAGRKPASDDQRQTTPTTGTMDALLSLTGRLGDGSSRRGACRVNIAHMQVGKVSPLANLLSVLSLSEPTDYTFERMLIDSYIRAGRLLIPKLDMSGRNVAFTGSGTMDLASDELNLMLTARGRRASEARPSVLQSLTEAKRPLASGQFFLLLFVRTPSARGRRASSSLSPSRDRRALSSSSRILTTSACHLRKRRRASRCCL